MGTEYAGLSEPLPDRSGVRPVGTRTRTCKALWNILSQSGRPSVVCGWQASHPAEPIKGAMISNLFAVPPTNATPQNWPIAEGSVQPNALAESLADLRVHPTEIEGSLLQQLIPRAAELDQSNSVIQRRLIFLAQRLAEVISVHAAATELLTNEAWDFGAVYYECIDQVGHGFMPFHPPRLPEISESDFEFLQGCDDRHLSLPRFDARKPARAGRSRRVRHDRFRSRFPKRRSFGRAVRSNQRNGIGRRESSFSTDRASAPMK